MQEITKELFEAFQEAVKYGKVNLSDMQAECEYMRRKEALEKHNNAIWQGSNGNWYTYLPDKTKPNNRRQIYRKNKRDLEDTIVDFYEQNENNPTIKDLFDEWEDYRIMQEQITHATRSRDERIYERHLAQWNDRKIRDIKPIEFVELVEQEAVSQKLNSKAISNLKGIIKGFLKRAKRRGLIDFSIEETLEAIEIPRGGYNHNHKRDSEDVFSSEEYQKILKYLQDNLDSTNLGLLLLAITGLRVGELAALTHDDFNDNGTFEVNKTETIFEDETGKTIREIKSSPKTEAGVRTVVIPKDYAWIQKKIKATNPFGDYVFLNHDGERATGEHFRNRLKRVCQKLDIPYRSPHKLRKAYASILLSAGVDSRTITTLLGHTDISCTENYYHRDMTTDKQRIDIISKIPELQAM